MFVKDVPSAEVAMYFLGVEILFAKTRCARDFSKRVQFYDVSPQHDVSDVDSDGVPNHQDFAPMTSLKFLIETAMVLVTAAILVQMTDRECGLG